MIFNQYTRFCNTGTAGYVTNYVTGFSNLPSIYRNASVKPFRLASKNPAIGFSSFDKFEVSQEISRGVIEFIKDIPRIECKSVLRFPKAYCHSLFPKCYQYSKLNDRRIREIYSACYLDAKRRQTKEDSSVNFVRLRAFMHPMNFNASLKCYKFCMEFGCSPDYYLYVLDMYYYKEAMYSLELFYKSMEGKSPLEIAYMYDNFGILLINRYQNNSISLELFLLGLGLENCDFDRIDFRKLLPYSVPDKLYQSEVSDIISNSVKVSKFNERVGAAPHIV